MGIKKTTYNVGLLYVVSSRREYVPIDWITAGSPKGPVHTAGGGGCARGYLVGIAMIRYSTRNEPSTDYFRAARYSSYFRHDYEKR
jgi:hypothetical protein